MLPPEFWQVFLQSSLTALREACRAVCVGMVWMRLVTAWAMQQWRPRLVEVSREVEQFGVAVRGGLEHVGRWGQRTLAREGQRGLDIADC